MASFSGSLQAPTECTHSNTECCFIHRPSVQDVVKSTWEWTTAAKTAHQERETQHKIKQAGFQKLSLRPRTKYLICVTIDKWGKALETISASVSLSVRKEETITFSGHYEPGLLDTYYFLILMLVLQIQIIIILILLGNHGDREVKWLTQGPTASNGQRQISASACVAPKSILHPLHITFLTETPAQRIAFSPQKF